MTSEFRKKISGDCFLAAPVLQALGNPSFVLLRMIVAPCTEA
jgi:hypothetical protein